VTHPLQEGDTVKVFSRSFRVLETPGHTLDHLCYFSDQATPVLFSGDTLFRGGCGRIMEGTAEQMLAAMNTLSALPNNTLVYCTHEYTLSNLRFAHAVEPDNQQLNERLAEVTRWREEGRISLPSTIELELATNPFLRASEPSIVAATEGRDDRQSCEPSAVFASLRAWKDTF